MSVCVGGGARRTERLHLQSKHRSMIFPHLLEHDPIVARASLVVVPRGRAVCKRENGGSNPETTNSARKGVPSSEGGHTRATAHRTIADSAWVDGSVEKDAGELLR